MDGFIQELRLRARHLRRAAAATLLLIIGVLAAGLSIFLLAGELAKGEARKALLEARRQDVIHIEEQLAKTEYELESVRASIARYRAELDKEQQGGQPLGLGPRAAEIKSMLRSAEERQNNLTEELRNLADRKDKAQAELASAGASGSMLVHGSEVSMLISVLVTRVSSIVLLLFLVQILDPSTGTIRVWPRIMTRGVMHWKL